MKNYNVKYIKGHLVDQNTGKRILLKRGGTFNLLGDDDQFEERDELQLTSNPLDEKEKFKSLRNSFRESYLEKIADAGTTFIYRIGLRQKTTEDFNSEFYFDAHIKEDLYMKSKDGKQWNLCSCLCITNECLSGDVQMIEPVPGSSLSNLFANVVTFYFPFQRSTTCNAFNVFSFAKKGPLMIEDYMLNSYNSLEAVRVSLIKQYEKENTA